MRSSQKICLHGKYFYNKFYPVGLLSGFLELVDDGVELIGLVLEGLHLLPDGVHGCCCGGLLEMYFIIIRENRRDVPHWRGERRATVLRSR